MQPRTISITFEGQVYKNTAEKLISFMEGIGHARLRAEQSPHDAFQMAEYLKREKL